MTGSNKFSGVDSFLLVYYTDVGAALLPDDAALKWRERAILTIWALTVTEIEQHLRAQAVLRLMDLPAVEQLRAVGEGGPYVGLTPDMLRRLCEHLALGLNLLREGRVTMRLADRQLVPTALDPVMVVSYTFEDMYALVSQQ